MIPNILLMKEITIELNTKDTKLKEQYLHIKVQFCDIVMCLSCKLLWWQKENDSPRGKLFKISATIKKHLLCYETEKYQKYIIIKNRWKVVLW